MSENGFFEKIIENISVCSIFVDENKIIRYANPTMEDLFGYKPEEIIGKNTYFLYEDRRNDKSNDTEIYDCLEKYGYHNGNGMGIKKNKNKIQLVFNTFIVKPHKGAIIFIEEIKGPDDSVTIDKGHFLTDLLDNVPDMIYFKDINNRFLLVNKAHAEALNMKQEDIIGKTDKDLFSAELAEKYFEDDMEIIRSGKPVTGKIEKAQRKDGGTTYVSTTKVPHYNTRGEIIGTIGITRNITDQMIVEEELREYKDKLEEMIDERTKELNTSKEQLMKMYEVKSDFTSMVSHELRTPLTVIKEGIAMVEDSTLGKINDQQKTSLGLAMKNINRLERLINGILDFSKLESKKMKFNIIEGNLNGPLEQVLQSYESVLDKKGIKLIKELDPSLPLIMFDEDRIVQVILNLLSNSVKYTDKGYIKVGTKVEGNNVVVFIEDSGCGMRKEYLARIFEKFEHLDSKDESKRKGTGLGLAISKQIVEQLGGKITVKSKLGKGSTFYITLPIPE